jgi:hypothetical protein
VAISKVVVLGCVVSGIAVVVKTGLIIVEIIVESVVVLGIVVVGSVIVVDLVVVVAVVVESIYSLQLFVSQHLYVIFKYVVEPTPFEHKRAPAPLSHPFIVTPNDVYCFKRIKLLFFSR